MKIRKATLSELPLLLKFEQAIIEAERPFERNMKQEKVTYYDIKELILSDKSEVLVAEIDGQLVASGYAKIKQSESHLVDDYHAYLGFMYVEPQHRGQGIIQQVIDHLITWSKAQGMTVVCLEVLDENSPAVNAYHKIGFRKNLVEMRMNLIE